MEKSVEYALSLAVDSMSSRKKQEERNLELEKSITEKDETISKLQKEIQEQKKETDVLKNMVKNMLDSIPNGTVPQTRKYIGSAKKMDSVDSEESGKRDNNETAKKYCSNCWHPFDKNEGLERATKKQRVGDSKQMNATCSKNSASDKSNSATGSNKQPETANDDSWMVGSAVSGGPFEPTVIPSFLGHVASRMLWANPDEMRGVLYCPNSAAARPRIKEWYERIPAMYPDVQAMIGMTGLSHLNSTMFDRLDMPLISAFIERWQPDTNSFHMPFGEMTIMLHDVWHILRIPVEGQMISARPDTKMSRCYCRNNSVKGGALTDSVFLLRGMNQAEALEAIAWLWVLLNATLFDGKSWDWVIPSCLHEFNDKINDAHSYSWGSATLANLYRELGLASRGGSRSVAGCLTLLQAWIYEYFPCFRPEREKKAIDVDSPRASMWSVEATENSDARLHSLRCRLEKLTQRDVTWLPYGTDTVSTVPRTIFTGWLRYRDIIEPYMPGRAIRQLGYEQTIPAPITTPVKAIRSWDSDLYKVERDERVAYNAWNMFPDSYTLPLHQYTVARVPGACCGVEYIEWYYTYSHPRLLASEYTQDSYSSEDTQDSYSSEDGEDGESSEEAA